MHRTIDTIACSAQSIAEKAGFSIPEDVCMLLVEEDNIGPEYHWCKEKMAPDHRRLQIQRRL